MLCLCLLRSTEECLSLAAQIRARLFEANLVDFFGKAQAAESLVVVGLQRTAADDRQRFGVSSEAVLKKVGELRLAKRRLFVSALKLFNHVRQDAETLINVFRLFEKRSLKNNRHRKSVSRDILALTTQLVRYKLTPTT